MTEFQCVYSKSQAAEQGSQLAVLELDKTLTPVDLRSSHDTNFASQDKRIALELTAW